MFAITCIYVEKFYPDLELSNHAIQTKKTMDYLYITLLNINTYENCFYTKSERKKEKKRKICHFYYIYKNKRDIMCK